MTFSEQVNEVKNLSSVTYGCFVAKFTPPLENEMKIRHIFGKMDQIVAYGNYGTPIQFLYVFKEFCDYLNGRQIPYCLRFTWVRKNNLWFNIKCLLYLLVNVNWLKTF